MPAPRQGHLPLGQYQSHSLLHKREILGMLCPNAPMGCITNQGYGYLALIPTCPPLKSSPPRDSEENFFLLLLLIASTQTRAW